MMVLTFWATDIANAVPVAFTDFIQPLPPVYLDGDGKKGPKSHTITHDITDSGFIPGLHSISQAELHITFDDDLPSCCIDTGEWIKVVIGGTTYGAWEIDHMDTFTLMLDSVALADLNTDGRLEVFMLMHNRGDLNFISADLVASLAETPEPSTLLLVGSGMAGIAGYGLRRRK
jgi:hypothetical protein